MNFRCAFVLLLGVCLGASAVAAPATQPAVPWRHELIVRENPLQRLHVVKIDLTDPRVRLRVLPGGEDPDGPGPWETVLATVRTVAERENLDIAINGDWFHVREIREIGGRKIPYFPGNWARAGGWAMTDGRLWAARMGAPAVVVLKDGRVLIDTFQRLPPDTLQAISGFAVIVRDGKNVAQGDKTAPRTAVGLSEDGQTLFLVINDGRRPQHSLGMTIPELADAMIELGCHTAINLDGGGSSTLLIRDRHTGQLQRINTPSDGHDLPIPLIIERSVVNVFGVMLVEE